MSKGDGGPAYPRTETTLSGNLSAGVDRYAGMSLRDWFAGQVMRNFIWDNEASCAKECYEIADAMLEQRGKK